MPFKGVFEVDLTPIYVNLGNTLGAYVVEPGETPFIVLHESLKDKQDPTAQIVYQALVAFHKSLPEVYRLFPLTQYFEDLPEVITEPDIIIIGRASRRWSYPVYLPQTFKLIG
jgi:hypothetical protein